MPDDLHSVYRQLDYLANQVTKVESVMIDPVAFGELKGAVSALKSELDGVKAKQAVMDEKLDQVLDRLSEAKGGWKLLMGLGGAAATLGSALTWLATHSVTVGPKG